MHTCVIIDDDALSIETLKTILCGYLNDQVTVIGTARDAESGLKIIQELRPDIVFLDVEMPVYNGFDMLEMIDEIQFEVIFTTGFDQYALTAIKFSALDYLLKPINIGELKIAVNKAIKHIKLNQSAGKVKEMLKLKNAPNSQEETIPISINHNTEMLKVKELIYCKADQDYTYLFIESRDPVLVSKNIKFFERILVVYDFFRVHHSFLVNKYYIKIFDPHKSLLILRGLNHQIPVSRRRKADFMGWLKS